MAIGFLWKPISEGGLNPGGTSVLLGSKRRPVSAGIYDADGNLVEELQLSRGTELGYKFYSKRPGASFGENLTVRVNYGDGTEEYQIGNGGQRYEGPLGDSNPGASNKGVSGTGVPSGLDPGNFDGLGFFPADLTGEFPSPVTIGYDPITGAPYEFTDPKQFAEEFGEFNREQIIRNNELAKGLALDALGTELEGLEGFVPGAAALKRRETSLDNIFNQQEREAAIQRGLPFARGDLEAQRGRANQFARGAIPDEIADRGLEIGLRSRAADRASSAGFGATSSVARKTSDLLSAEERVRLSQYGDQLLTGNIREQERLFVPPTSYSTAGQEVRVMPSLSGSQLQTAARGEIGQQTLLSPGQALQSQIQQNQFTTGIEQQTRMFNAGNILNKDQFNANIQNQFALTKFGYQVSLAGAIAGAAQTASNTQIALDQQQQALDLFQETQKAAQRIRNINAAFEGILGLVSAFGGVGGLLDAVSSLVSGKKKKTTTGGTGTGSSGSGSTRRPGAGTGAGSDVVGDDSGEDPSDISDVDDTEDPDDNRGTDVADEPDREPRPGEDVGKPGPADQPEEEEPPVEGTDPSDVPENVPQPPPSPDEEPDFGTEAATVRFMARAAKLPPTKAMQAAGISTRSGPNKLAAGYDNSGRRVYMDRALENNRDANYGANSVKSLKDILTPFDVLSDDDATTLDKIAELSRDTAFYGNLTDLYLRGDKKGFVNAVLNKVQRPAINKLLPGERNRENRAGLNAAVDAAQLFANWDRMSPASKSQAIASIALDAYQFGTGTNLRQIDIIKPGTAGPGTPGLNVGQALKLFNAGFNVYNLVNNWDEYNDVQRVAGATGTLSSIATLADDLGLLGTQAATSGTAAAAGSSGTIFGFSGTGAAAGATALGVVGGAAGIYLGAEALRNSWGKGGKEGAIGGAVAGASMALGLTAMTGGAGAPIAAGVFAVAVLGSVIKTGKEENQVKRDLVRKQMKKIGLVDSDFKISLPDGSSANLGVDGKGGRHEALDRSKLVHNVGGRKLYSYDIDYTNDLDYISGMSGIALSRMISGGQAKNVDQVGGQLGNQALGKVGFGKNLTAENFNSVMQNHRAIYSQAGIKSKADAYALTNTMLQEGRINASQAVSMQQAFNMMYDRNGFDTAKKLMNGRWAGVQVAGDKSKNNDKEDKHIEPGKPTFGDDVVARRPTFEGDERIPTERIDVNKELTKARPFTPRRSNARIRSREEVVAANRSRYAA